MKQANTTTTLAQVCKAIITDAIDHDYLLECGSLSNVFRSEYAYNFVSPKACMDYLQGLPSVCTVPFYNGRILDTLEKAGIDIPEDDDGQHDMIEAYWLECGKAFYNLVK